MSATRTCRRLGVLGIAVVLAATVGRADEPVAVTDEAGSADVAPEVVIDGDRVTATFTKASPETIVQSIANAAGAELIGGTENTDPTSVDLDDVPIDRALARALRGQSFTIVYGGDGSVRRISLHGGPQATAEQGRLIARKPPTSAGRKMGPGQLFDVAIKIPSIGPLAEHLGTDTATLGQLYKIATDEDEAALRIAAVDASMAALETDAQLQASVDSLLESTDNAALGAMLRGSAGNRANELVSRILSRTRRPQVRQRAVALLRQLRQPTE